MHSPFLSHAFPAAKAIAAAEIGRHIKHPEPLPMAQWPVWAQTLARSHQPQDTGLGDTVMHLIGDTRSEKFKTWWKEVIGSNCGCIERQHWLNTQYPYPRSSAAAPQQQP